MRWDELMDRAGGVCEFCGTAGELTSVDVPPSDQVLLCAPCRGEGDVPAAHWRCLEGAMWSTEPAVQIAVYRRLGEIEEMWASDAKDSMMMDPDVLARAQDVAEVVDHFDSNGMRLEHGDTVVLVKDLPVKGAGFTAKRGTAVRNISLVPDNAAHIEGRVEGQRIVILTEFVKRK
ncbi:PhnA domain-containing protein [Octadecabacter sp. 1_MG-2023]|uniref:PhnA domain-containing protein n=1 Tax=unclassified Octadecabacter TaxID=196158 RepID=UPI001C09CB5C|nr:MULTISPECIES: alkylphosphonate utilization protein [unclassified Octadecabacter]MBU2994457.1 PhnA domain-containing protein [Octadecabacter sp. B2R22]MDO6734252.1 PhnA domain-containing protein [Octadecabacter sp. 1_MG-2023]